MNRFFTLVLAASCLTAVGQVQGDVNGDGCVQLNDLLDVLVSFGIAIPMTRHGYGEPLLYQDMNMKPLPLGSSAGLPKI